MKIVNASAAIEYFTPNLEQEIERAGRVCYKSEDRITETSVSSFIKRMLESKHESTIEHGSITVRFICDRGISHELVRHRLASFSQESTRYCNYSKEKFGKEITFIDIRGGFPYILNSAYQKWEAAMEDAETFYFSLLTLGASPQEARSVLPNSVKTELVVTANPREWRHIFKLRTSKHAHPQMVELMLPLLEKFKISWPNLFGDIQP